MDEIDTEADAKRAVAQALPKLMRMFAHAEHELNKALDDKR